MLLELSVFLIALFVVEILLYNEKFLGALIPVIGVVAFSIFYLQFNFLTFLYAHSSEVVMYSVGYLVVGVILSMFKWKGYVKRYYENYNESYLYRNKTDNIYNIGSETKRDYIVGHITWWPFVLLVDALHKPFELAYEYLVTIYDKIENSEKQKFIATLPEKKDDGKK